MPYDAENALLKRLTKLITRYDLHSGDPIEPVNPFDLVENYQVDYQSLPEHVLGISVQVMEGRRAHAAITLNAELQADTESRYRRYACTHEFAHIFCRDQGDLFVMWRGGVEGKGFDRYVKTLQEAQCDRVSAFILVRMEALRNLAFEETNYIARLIDVPPQLVELRWGIWRKYGR